MTLDESREAFSSRHPRLEDLAAYYEGRLPAEENDLIRSHLVACSGCASVVLDLSAAADLDAVPAVSSPESARSWQELREAIDEQNLWPRARRAAADRWRGWKTLAMAASVAAVISTGSSLWLWQQSSSRIVSQVDPPWVGLAPAEDLRSSGPDIRQELVLPPGVRGWISLAYSAPDTIVRVRVRFFRASGSIATWDWSGARPEDSRILRMELTAQELAPGDYRIELDGRAKPEDPWTPVARYFLRIVGHEGS